MNKKMPVIRSVKDTAPSCEEEVNVDATKPLTMSNSITIFGYGGNDVLYHSNQARIALWRDSAGSPIAMLVRLKPSIWGFSKRGDPDWEENIKAYIGNPEELFNAQNDSV